MHKNLRFKVKKIYWKKSNDTIIQHKIVTILFDKIIALFVYYFFPTFLKLSYASFEEISPHFACQVLRVGKSKWLKYVADK